jgi:hypothetical protein
MWLCYAQRFRRYVVDGSSHPEDKTDFSKGASCIMRLDLTQVV